MTSLPGLLAPDAATPPIEFYRIDRPWGELSSLWPAPIMYDDRVFATCEHGYQFGKFKDSTVAEVAMLLPPPYLAVLAHGLFAWQIAPGWGRNHLLRMMAVQRAKYSQHAKLADVLLSSGEAELVERSSDTDWGINKSGRGRNYLGLILMIIRSDLRRSRGLGELTTLETMALARYLEYVVVARGQ